VTAGAHRAPAIPRAERGRHRAKTADQLLAEYRWWAMALVALIVYVLLVLPIGYYDYGLHNPGYVVPNVGVLIVLWGVVAKTSHTWDRHVTARRRERRTADDVEKIELRDPGNAGAPAQVTCAGAPGLT